MNHHVNFIKKKIDEKIESGNDNAFYTLDLEDVGSKYRKWVELIPRVTPFYAVKCNDDKNVVKCLAKLGAGFDCASKKELEQILNLGVAPERIIFSHTAKQISHLKFASDKNVRKVTFDSKAELVKIQIFHPQAEVILRIRFDSNSSIDCLGIKFGCDPDTEAADLIKLCKVLKVNLIGISFHVGSGTKKGDVYGKALAKVSELFKVASKIGFQLKFVDIGGGFVGHDVTLLSNYAAPINSAVDKYFDDSITIISEPGRYFVESAFSLAIQVILKRETSDGFVHYFVNDGIYSSFLISFLYDYSLNFEIIKKSSLKNETSKRLSIIWGQTCHPKDKIVDNRMIPDMDIGDWLVFHKMGAYTSTLSTNFNGFKIAQVFLIDS